MQQIVRTLFPIRGRKGRPVSSYSPAGRLSIAALAILSVGGWLSNSAAAQASAQTPVTGIRVKQPLSPEILAMHARAKRPVAAVPTGFELAATTTVTSTTFNSDQGPGPGPIGPGPGPWSMLKVVDPSEASAAATGRLSGTLRITRLCNSAKFAALNVCAAASIAMARQ